MVAQDGLSDSGVGDENGYILKVELIGFPHELESEGLSGLR